MHPGVWLPSPWGQPAEGTARLTGHSWWHHGHRALATTALLAKQRAEAKETGTTQDTLGRFPMVTAAMEIFFCWLDLNNIWLLGCSTLPARLGWILRPAPRYRGATASSTGCL